MAIKWTKEQQQVLQLRNRNILVSAAAGSGKTAVLVQRIIGMITDSAHPVDIDRLLIVTFTSAAAAEMRERIEKAINAQVEQHPEDLHLRRQATLIHQAQITTIHSFCLNVIRNHFYQLDLDPAFRIGDEAELALIQTDVVTQLLEENYEEATEAFLDFSQCLSGGKNDKNLDGLILDLFRFSRSHPWPMEWLEQCENLYKIKDEKSLEESILLRWDFDQTKMRLEEVAKLGDQIMEICTHMDGPKYLLEVFTPEVTAVQHAAKAEDMAQLKERMDAIVFGRKPRKKKNDPCSTEMDNEATELRKQIKKIVDEIRKKSFKKDTQKVLDDIQLALPLVQELVRLTKEFSTRYAETKRKKNLLDFNDLEHLALEILTEKVGEELVPTPVAKQMAEQFEEIMIDEYQDSNMVQEILLNAVSKAFINQYNVFMVGDVKQSIYKFRLARPELFMEKYHSYTSTDSDHQKIELHKNFRSRDTVIQGINLVFYQLMQQRFGDIEYNDDNALYAGMEYPAPTKENTQGTMPERCQIGGPMELLVLDDKIAKDYATKEIFQEKELEAILIGQRIRELLDPEEGQWVLDKETQKYRPARLGDIVILLRSVSGYAQSFVDTLAGMGIAAYAESKEEFFDTWEVRTLLSLLQIIDNPIQDIPLAAVMHSPLGNFTAQELAQLRQGYSLREQGNGFYGAITDYIKNHKDALAEKVTAFFQKVKEYRKASQSRSLSQLIRFILNDSGFLTYLSAMPSGERRSANARLLMEKAEAFEKTTYHGIFHFIRYIEKLKKQNQDNAGSSSTLGENMVQISSIHKSKGLEFPIVILAGCGKGMNLQDSRKKVVFHADFGVGMDAVDWKGRRKTATIYKQIIGKKLNNEAMGEELRVLYVALTRAKEKLIITGLMSGIDEKRDIYEKRFHTEPYPLTLEELNHGGAFLGWLLLAFRKKDYTKFQICSHEDLFYRAVVENALQRGNVEILRRLGAEALPSQELNQIFTYPYHYNDLYRAYASISVSALKQKHIEEMELETPVFLQEEVDAVPAENGAETPSLEIRPKFMEEKEEKTGLMGAARGTLYHNVMEKIDPHQSVEAQLKHWVETGYFTQEEADTISVSKIQKFLQSPLGQRFVAAADGGHAYKEKQFIIGLPIKQVLGQEFSNVPPEERIMIQGIIDGYFEEGEDLILFDYKTDRVQKPEDLVERYRIQLDLYATALHQITGKKVKEIWIYSFYFDREIPLPVQGADREDDK